MSTVTNEHLRPMMLLAHGVPPRPARLHEWKCGGAFQLWYENRGRHKHKIHNYDPEVPSTYAIPPGAAWLAFHNWVVNYVQWINKQQRGM